MDKVLTTKEAAEILGLSPRTLQGQRRRGVGPKFIKTSTRCVRYRKSDLEKYLSDHERNTDTQRSA